MPAGSPTVEPSLIDEAADILRKAGRVLFVTGAGISAESGLPTYRGVGGLCTDMITDDDLAIEEVLSGTYFREHPKVTWKYIRQVEKACRGASFNAAHEAIAHLQSRLDEVIVLTQNVDGFHRDAGSKDVIDIHGDIRDLICTGCPWNDRVEDYSALKPLPRCPECNEIVRPDVVLFGELLPMEKVGRLMEEQAVGFDAVFSVGTSSLFPYIAAPVMEAADAGIPTVEINPEETPISHLVDVKLRMKAGQAMTQLLRAMAH